MTKPTIQIIIVDDSKSEKCDAHCEEDWSSTQAINLASQRIKERFGDQIKLEYLDLAKAMTHHLALELKQQLSNEMLTFPLLVINGKPRILGQFDIRLLLDTIDAELEIKS